MKLELYNSDYYRSVEQAREDGATTVVDGDSSFIEGVRTACDVLGMHRETIKFHKVIGGNDQSCNTQKQNKRLLIINAINPGALNDERNDKKQVEMLAADLDRVEKENLRLNDEKSSINSLYLEQLEINKQLKTDNYYLNKAGEHMSALLLVEHGKNEHIDLGGASILQFQYKQLRKESVVLRTQLQSIINSELNFHGEAMGCGLEDEGITDRYEAMLYGWNKATKQFYSEIVPSVDDIETPAINAAINEIKEQAVKELFTDYLIEIASILDAPVVIDGQLKDADSDYLYSQIVNRCDAYIAQLRKGE